VDFHSIYHGSPGKPEITCQFPGLALLLHHFKRTISGLKINATWRFEKLDHTELYLNTLCSGSTQEVGLNHGQSAVAACGVGRLRPVHLFIRLFI
jgi:hypothetical protein